MDYRPLVDWINDKLVDKGWSLRKLGKEANISHSTISLVLSERQAPTADFCIAVAGAFKASPLVALSKAGIVSSLDDDQQLFAEVLHQMRQMRYRDRVKFLRMMKAWANEETEENGGE